MWVWMNQADFTTINNKLDAILTQLGVDHRLLQAVKTEEDNIMSAISDAVAALTAKASEIENTEDAALIVLNGLKEQLASAIANAADATAAVANVQQVISGMDTHNAPLASAIATPPA